MDNTVFLLFVVISCVCCCYGAEVGEKITVRDLLEKSSKNDENTVTLPVYAIYLFGFGLVLLILLLIFLIFVLIKTKFLEICNKNVNNSGNTEMGCATNPRQEVHHKSLKRLDLNRSHSFEYKNKSIKYQDLKENDGNNTLKSTKGEFSTLRTPAKTESSGNISPRIIKGLTKDMPIILPEQMSRICKEVLTRTHKNDETTGSLQNIDVIANETILEEEIEKKYASSPVLDLYDVPPSTLKNDNLCNEIKSNKEDCSNSTQLHNEIYDMPKELIDSSKEDLDSKTQLLNNIYDMPKELPNSNKEDFGNHSDDIYDLPKERDNSNNEDFDSKTQILSHDIYDMPKELLDNAQVNYVKPYFRQKTQDGVSLKLNKSFKKPDYASLNTPSCVKDSIDKIYTNTEQNAYDFPPSTQIEGNMYINANCVV